jgi:hypothetical protein
MFVKNTIGGNVVSQNFLQSPITSFLLGPNILLSTVSSSNSNKRMKNIWDVTQSTSLRYMSKFRGKKLLSLRLSSKIHTIAKLLQACNWNFSYNHQWFISKTKLQLIKKIQNIRSLQPKFKCEAEVCANKTDGLPKSQQTKAPDCLAFQASVAGALASRQENAVRPMNCTSFIQQRRTSFPLRMLFFHFHVMFLQLLRMWCGSITATNRKAHDPSAHNEYVHSSKQKRSNTPKKRPPCLNSTVLIFLTNEDHNTDNCRFA